MSIKYLIVITLALFACAEPGYPAQSDAPGVGTLDWYTSFHVDPALPEAERTELSDALASVAARWSRATCLRVSVRDESPHVVTMGNQQDMHEEDMGRAEGSWDALVLTVARGYSTETVLLHEMAHGIGWTNSHAKVFTDSNGRGAAAFAAGLHPVALITPNDLEVVCAAQNCGCFSAEVN